MKNLLVSLEKVVVTLSNAFVTGSDTSIEAEKAVVSSENTSVIQKNVIATVAMDVVMKQIQILLLLFYNQHLLTVLKITQLKNKAFLVFY